MHPRNRFANRGLELSQGCVGSHDDVMTAPACPLQRRIVERWRCRCALTLVAAVRNHADDQHIVFTNAYRSPDWHLAAEQFCHRGLIDRTDQWRAVDILKAGHAAGDQLDAHGLEEAGPNCILVDLLLLASDRDA